MRTFTEEELNDIIEKHAKWLMNVEGGERADFSGADLHRANLAGVNLNVADLRGANLSGANLSGANLARANLAGVNLNVADLRGADLCGANLSGANLWGVILSKANLHMADFRGANLSRAILRGANLLGAKFRGASFSEADLFEAKNIPYIPMACPDTGAFFGWKKAGGHIVKLWIPEDARRSSATGRKCRCDKAVVVTIEEIDGRPTIVDQVVSNYDPDFIYKVHCTVRVDDFCEDRFAECAPGIHFFINRQEAVDY